MTWLVTAISLLIITKLPLGIRIDSFSTALGAAAVLGILNAVVTPVLQFFAFPLTILTLGFFYFVINAIVFALASEFVNGFYIKGWLNALIGPIVLGFINSLIFTLVK
jgi:putative membrane protein